MYRTAPVVILISDQIAGRDCFQFFSAIGRWSNVDVNVTSGIQNEAIAFVHLAQRHLNLVHTNIFSAFDMEQTLRSIVVDRDLFETTCDATGNVSNALVIYFND